MFKEAVLENAAGRNKKLLKEKLSSKLSEYRINHANTRPLCQKISTRALQAFNGKQPVVTSIHLLSTEMAQLQRRQEKHQKPQRNGSTMTTQGL